MLSFESSAGRHTLIQSIISEMAILSTKIERIDFIKKAKDWWLQYETKIVLILGFILVSAVSFEFGLIQGKKWQKEPLVIEKTVPAVTETKDAVATTPPEAQELPSPAVLTTSGASATLANCRFAGSKNSDKIHVPTCSWAKRIKPENLVCFATLEEALAKGRVKDKCIP